MYCKESYGPNTSKLKRERFRYTTPFFHEDKENLHTTIYARMQENHNPNCSGCRKSFSGKESSVKPSSHQKSFCFKMYERPLRENCCSDCCRITRNKNRTESPENHYDDGDNFQHSEMPVYMQENYKPVYNTRRRYKSARGSMYGCDQIYVEDIPSCNDVNNGANIKQRQAKTYDSTKCKVENCTASETSHSKYSEKCQGCSETKSHHIDSAKRSRMSRNNKIGSHMNHSNTNDSCSSKRVASNDAGGSSRSFAKDESESYVNFTDRSETSRKTFTKDETNPAFTDSKKVKANPGKGETIDREDAERAESFEEKDKDQTKSVETEEDAPKHDANEHGGRDRAKVPKVSRRMPRRRVQKEPQTHETQSRGSENRANGGIDEWMLFVFDSIRKGVVSTLSETPSYLSIGWWLLVYFLLVLILLVFLVLSGIWTFIKRCLLYVVGMFCSIGNKIFKKQPKNSAETTEQQSRRPATRQRSDPLPEADELVSKLLASKELDAYEVLGVLPSATDEEIRRRYREMAKVVHPDKNPHEDASEAFKILQSAFESIGDEEKRMSYHFDNEKKRFQEEFDEFFENFMKRVQQMKNRIMCRVCQDSHPRSLTDRSIFAARYCSECGVRHPAKEGDVWVETSHMGFKYYCFLCMGGKVYEVTEWGACQGILRVRANAHTVFISVKPNHSPWPRDDMFGYGDRSNFHGNYKKKRKSKGKSNKNKKR